jgi:hypothetical protein
MNLKQRKGKGEKKGREVKGRQKWSKNSSQHNTVEL